MFYDLTGISENSIIFEEENLDRTKVSKIQRKETTFLTYHVKSYTPPLYFVY